jgi:hypothetical protein
LSAAFTPDHAPLEFEHRVKFLLQSLCLHIKPALLLEQGRQ